MKLYNPFRWHIAANANRWYVVRKFHIFWGWQYLNRDTIQVTWSDVGLCLVDTLEKATILRDSRILLDLSKEFKAV